MVPTRSGSLDGKIQNRSFARKTARSTEPAVGFEPTTSGLQNRCSTTELSRPFDSLGQQAFPASHPLGGLFDIFSPHFFQPFPPLHARPLVLNQDFDFRFSNFLGQFVRHLSFHRPVELVVPVNGFNPFFD